MSFPLVGNGRIKESISALVAAKRLPHAVIIEGDVGTGKRTLARYLAKIAVCESDSPPCGDCRNCHLADAGTHPDIETVAPEEKKKNINVDQIRELRTTAYHSAHTASRRVFIIEQADTMTAASQNSLLKVLEEPPSDVLFILIATAAKNLLETVVSRCMVLSLFPPTYEEALAYLTDEKKLLRDEASILLKEENNNVGKVFLRLSNSKDSVGRAAAHDYFAAIKSGSALSALLSTVPLEKDRLEAGRFTDELLEILSDNVKKSVRLIVTAGEYLRMQEVVFEMKPLLETNINLQLYFAALTSRITAVTAK